MIKKILLTIVLTLPLVVNAQTCTPLDGCNKTIKCDKDNHTLFKQSWSNFQGADLDKIFPADVKDRTIISIRLDAHGCVYPPFIDLIPEKYFINWWKRYSRYVKFSFFDVFQLHGTEIVSTLRSKGYDENLLKKLESLIYEVEPDIDKAAKNIFEFRREWNKLFLTPVISSINKACEDQQVKETFWFVGGFNVPYSLQHVQGNKMFKLIDEKAGDKKILLIRVYWPSESAKRINRKGKYRDRITPMTPLKYQYVANRSYTGGLTLRTIMGDLLPGIDVNFISHSHGAAMITASMIDPDGQMVEQNKESPFNRTMLREFVEVQKQMRNRDVKVRAFMSAPGMPGRSTFENLNASLNKNHYFYVGWNYRDKVLLKKQAIIPFPKALSATSLGCNNDEEVVETAKIFAREKLGDHFQSYSTGNQKEHDLFCYMSQVGFNQLFNIYMQDCLGD